MNDKQKEIANNLRELMVKKLRLPIKPEEISYDMNLLGDELELDSVDFMELIAIIDNQYGIRMTGEHKKFFEKLGDIK